MKFFTSTYKSPNKQQGTFQNVYVEDCGFTHNRKDKNLRVDFKMYYLDTDGTTEIDIHRSSMNFSDGSLGTPGPQNYMNNSSTNQTMMARIPNPNYNAEDSTSQETTIVPALPIIMANAGVLPEGVVITDWGFPNYTDVLGYVNGGDLLSPELHISNPLAVGFILNKLTFDFSMSARKSISDLGFELVVD